MPRKGFALVVVAFFVVSAASSAAAQTLRPALVVWDASADFNHDGHSDSASWSPRHPELIRVTLSGVAVRDILQPAPVIAVAGADYDKDGDIDLLVSTLRGVVIWLNTGAGRFSDTPILAFTPGPPNACGRTWVANLHDVCLPTEGPAFAVQCGGAGGREAVSVDRCRSIVVERILYDPTSDSSFPRAPPRF